MKRTLSLILAALLLASSMTACGNSSSKETEKSETQAVETKAPDTEAPATEAPDTNPPETEAPAPVYPYDTSLITENGVAKSHIVLFDGASDFEKYAADELVLHLKLVTGADVTVTNAPQSDSLPIIIATPDTLPELETLFPEDLAWLRTLTGESTGKYGRMSRWDDDGFAIRAHEGKIYIFGATAAGARNGVYDFMEENMDVLWIGNTDNGIFYDEMPTVTVAKVDYREKSPFSITESGHNGWGVGSLRNKNYSTAYPYGPDANVVPLIQSSPIYDPNITEYWDTDRQGNPMTADTTQQVNFWSDLAAEAIAASVIAKLDAFDDASRPVYYNVCMQDIHAPSVYPQMLEPFEYAPGQIVEPTDAAFLSTVYFTFINKIAKIVGEKYPDVYINTLAYMWATASPKCDLEKNISVWFCPYWEDYTQENFAVSLEKAETTSFRSAIEARHFDNWLKEHPDTTMLIYNYYFCHFVLGWYERPLWDRLQSDLQLFAEEGMLGMTFCGNPAEGNGSLFSWQKANQKGSKNPDDFEYKFTYGEGWAMNLLTLWLSQKLMWNPYEDVDALIVRFCDKVYGDASEAMQEYYALLEYGWNYGATEIIPYLFNMELELGWESSHYFDYFMDFELEDGTYYLDAVKAALAKAWEAADDRAKELIRHPYEVFSGDWTRFLEN